VRLAGILLLLATGVALIGLNSFYTREAREIEQKTGIVRAYYEKQLPRLEDRWLGMAEQTRARIEFTRILEAPDSTRWAKLNTFLTAQWEFVDFSSLQLFSPQGELLFRYGTEADHLPPKLPANKTGWHYFSDSREAYRVFEQPIWLGEEGRGTLLLYKPLNPGVLQSIMIPEVHLHLVGFGEVLASSDQFMKFDGETGHQGLHRLSNEQYIQVEMRWPHPAPQSPTLVIHREFNDSMSMREFMLRPLGAIVLIAVMLWLGLGRWLKRLAGRVDALQSATRLYGEGASMAVASQALQPAHDTYDEIDDVADTFEVMMQAIQNRDLEQRSYLETLSLLEEAVLELDCEGRVLHASPGWYRLTRCADNLKGVAITEFVHREDVDALRGIYQSFRSGDKTQSQLRLRLRSDGGDEQWAECRLIAQHDGNRQLSGIRGVLRDITQTYLHEQQITHMALHDALTDLPNRILLEDRIKIATRMASRSQHSVAVCFIDLDHFKNINDSLGHKAGDRLLIAFSATLRGQLRAGDTLARWGGDEFVLLLPELANEDDAREVAHKIEAAFRQPITIEEGTDYVVTFSMGVAMFPDDALNVEGLLSHADRAMFYAKTQGRNQTSFFGEIADKGGGKRELYIQNKLVEAVAQKRIQAWFQPIVTADSGTCEVVEVLARWHDSEFGWISPATFIPIAENTGTIRELGYQIWEQSLDALWEWHRRGIPLRAAINVSKRQLFSEQFSARLVSDLNQRGLEPSAVILEVTESVALLDVAHASERLEDLHRRGFHLAIDDFGTGYSALSQLHEMPAKELKIDISFVRRIHEPAGLSMVQAIIHLAQALKLKTIAEGVEDAATADLLRSLGTDYLQGYHFAKPMPHVEFEAWLASR